MANSNTTIGNRIKKLRDDKKETQADLAKALRVKRETVNQWENGTRDLKTLYTVLLAEHFKTTCDYILCGIKSENISVSRKTGLTDEAIGNIETITSTLNSYCETIDKNKKIKSATYTKETKDVLIEILTSESFLKLIYDITRLTNEYYSLNKITPIVSPIKFENLPNDITDRFNYKLWLTNATAQKLISDVLESYYSKTKDGVKTFSITLNYDDIIDEAYDRNDYEIDYDENESIKGE